MGAIVVVFTPPGAEGITTVVPAAGAESPVEPAVVTTAIVPEETAVVPDAIPVVPVETAIVDVVDDTVPVIAAAVVPAVGVAAGVGVLATVGTPTVGIVEFELVTTGC